MPRIDRLSELFAAQQQMLTGLADGPLMVPLVGEVAVHQLGVLLQIPR